MIIFIFNYPAIKMPDQTAVYILPVQAQGVGPCLLNGNN